MLYRKISHYIEDFYKTSSNALLLTGARQTGKTYSARMLGKQFDSFIELNFIEHPEAISIFENVTSADEILLRLSAITTTAMIPGKTLIFFSEFSFKKYLNFLCLGSGLGRTASLGS